MVKLNKELQLHTESWFMPQLFSIASLPMEGEGGMFVTAGNLRCVEWCELGSPF